METAKNHNPENRHHLDNQDVVSSGVPKEVTDMKGRMRSKALAALIAGASLAIPGKSDANGLVIAGGNKVYILNDIESQEGLAQVSAELELPGDLNEYGGSMGDVVILPDNRIVVHGANISGDQFLFVVHQTQQKTLELISTTTVETEIHDLEITKGGKVLCSTTEGLKLFDPNAQSLTTLSNDAYAWDSEIYTDESGAEHIITAAQDLDDSHAKLQDHTLTGDTIQLYQTLNFPASMVEDGFTNDGGLMLSLSRNQLVLTHQGDESFTFPTSDISLESAVPVADPILEVQHTGDLYLTVDMEGALTAYNKGLSTSDPIQFSNPVSDTTMYDFNTDIDSYNKLIARTIVMEPEFHEALGIADLNSKSVTKYIIPVNEDGEDTHSEKLAVIQSDVPEEVFNAPSINGVKMISNKLPADRFTPFEGDEHGVFVSLQESDFNSGDVTIDFLTDIFLNDNDQQIEHSIYIGDNVGTTDIWMYMVLHGTAGQVTLHKSQDGSLSSASKLYADGRLGISTGDVKNSEGETVASMTEGPAYIDNTSTNSVQGIQLGNASEKFAPAQSGDDDTQTTDDDTTPSTDDDGASADDDNNSGGGCSTLPMENELPDPSTLLGTAAIAGLASLRTAPNGKKKK